MNRSAVHANYLLDWRVCGSGWASLSGRPRKKSKIVLFTSILELISNELQNQKGSITNIKILFAGTSFRARDGWGTLYPGRCPGLGCAAPSEQRRCYGRGYGR